MRPSQATRAHSPASPEPPGELVVLDPNLALDGDDKSDVDNPYTYTGRRFDDETGLYYYRNRYYHAQLGRFISRDPIVYLDGMSLYAYVGGRPTRFRDPTGLEGIDDYCYIYGNCERPFPFTPNPKPFDDLHDRLEKECEKLGDAGAQIKCKEDAQRVIDALRNAQEAILENGTPSYLTCFGPICTECENEVLKRFPHTDYFRYETQFRWTPYWPGSDHVWGTLTFDDERIITIDFWSDVQDFWREGPNAFGWTHDEDKPEPKKKDKCGWYGRFQ